MKEIISIIVFSTILCSCTTTNKITRDEKNIMSGDVINIPTKDLICDTQYPILFVHGSGYRDDKKIYNYWGRIPKSIRQHGGSVYYANQDAWGSIESNSLMIKDSLEKVLIETGKKKVNIISHSRGGLEVRYLIDELKMEPYIASLTTISTPHRGTKILNPFVTFPTGLYKFVSFWLNLNFRIQGDKHPDFYNSSKQLSEIYCKEFNKKHLDSPSIYYQSYSSKMSNLFSDPILTFTYPLLKITDGENDGLCPVDSAKWGNYRGNINSNNFIGISHAGIVDAYWIKYGGVDIRDIYVDMVHDLKIRGL